MIIFNTLRKGLSLIDDLLNRIILNILFIGMSMLVVIILLNVILRYAFSSPLVWAEETSKYLMLWLALLGAQVALRSKLHIGLKLFIDMFPSNISYVIYKITNFIVLIFLIVLTIEGYKLTVLSKRQTWATLDLPLLYVYVAIPISAFLMIITLLNKEIFSDSKNRKN